MFSVLAAVVEVAGKSGEIVKVSRNPLIEIAPFVLIFLIFGLVFSYLFYKRRLEHKQILAAIEKGTPLSELRPAKPAGPDWIKSFTVGIALLVISLPFLFQFLEPLIRRDYICSQTMSAFAVLFAIGLAFFIRGLLLRKAQRQIQAPDKISTGEDKSRDIGG